MKVIEMSVGEENEVDGRQIFNLQAATLDAFQQEKPVREIRINQNVDVRELNQKRSVTNPGDRNLARRKRGENWLATFARAPRDQGFPDHFMKEGAGFEMLGGRQFLE